MPRKTGERPFSFYSNTNMTVIRSSTIKKHTHPVFQFVWAGMLLLVLAFPADAMAGNMLEKAIELVNKEREANGLSLVAENALLTKAAEAKADDMLKNDYFAHTSPLGETPWYWLKHAGYSYRAAGENLAINYNDPKEQHKAWMKSTTHRANILNSRFEEIGMATRHGRINGKDATVTVQLFGAPRNAVAAKAPETPKVTPEKSIQGMETETKPEVMIKSEPLPVIPAPSMTTTVTVLVNKTVFEKILSLPIVTDHAWLAWGRLFFSIIFFSVALIVPFLFVGEMTLRLKSLFRDRRTV